MFIIHLQISLYCHSSFIRGTLTFLLCLSLSVRVYITLCFVSLAVTLVGLFECCFLVWTPAGTKTMLTSIFSHSLYSCVCYQGTFTGSHVFISPTLTICVDFDSKSFPFAEISVSLHTYMQCLHLFQNKNFVKLSWKNIFSFSCLLKDWNRLKKKKQHIVVVLPKLAISIFHCFYFLLLIPSLSLGFVSV